MAMSKTTKVHPSVARFSVALRASKAPDVSGAAPMDGAAMYSVDCVSFMFLISGTLKL
jgi:hypothetical protein